MDPQKGKEVQLLAKIATLLQLPEGSRPVSVLKAVVGLLEALVDRAAPGNGSTERVHCPADVYVCLNVQARHACLLLDDPARAGPSRQPQPAQKAASKTDLPGRGWAPRHLPA